MKLRIKGNTLRLRLSQSEVARLADGGLVWEKTSFAPGQSLMYEIENSAAAVAMTASLEEGAIRVLVPAAMIRTWAKSDQVSIDGEQDADNGETLRMLIEKDFECLDAPADKDQSDAFPHPQRGTGCPPK